MQWIEIQIQITAWNNRKVSSFCCCSAKMVGFWNKIRSSTISKEFQFRHQHNKHNVFPAFKELNCVKIVIEHSRFLFAILCHKHQHYIGFSELIFRRIQIRVIVWVVSVCNINHLIRITCKSPYVVYLIECWIELCNTVGLKVISFFWGYAVENKHLVLCFVKIDMNAIH